MSRSLMEEMNLGLRGRGLISGRVAAIVVLEARILVARTQAHYCRDGSEPRKVARNVRGAGRTSHFGQSDFVGTADGSEGEKSIPET